jgi:hypothetical protein
VTVTVDARSLSLPSLALDVSMPITNAAPLPFTALPGTYPIEDAAGSGAFVQFTVTAAGKVTYDPALEGTLTGTGAATLVVHGVTVTVDVRSLSLPSLALDVSVPITNAAPLAFTGLPRTYSIDEIAPTIRFTLRVALCWAMGLPLQA